MNEKVTRPDPYCRGLVLAREPLIILSSSDLSLAPLGVASLLPALFLREASLHFLSPSYSQLDQVMRLSQCLRRASIELPRARFVFLASDDAELHVLQKAGFEVMLGNHNIFIDEKVFRPLHDSSDVEFDALYNAMFSPVKNHHLCTQIERLALVHYSFPSMKRTETDVRVMLPNARILNEENADGTYRRLPPQEVAEAINRAATGLCLSAVEGAMTSSMEYLLCGTPVVSIPSKGGRDRYFLSPYAEIAAPDPESVARAVQRLKRRRLPRAVVREYMATLLTFERRNFMIALNLKIADMAGPGREILDFETFRGSARRRSTQDWHTDLTA